MLIRYFPAETKANTVAYAAGFDRDEDPRKPHVLHGDPVVFQRHVERSPYAQTHTAFALCFEEELKPAEALLVFNEMVDVMVVGRRVGATSLLAIQHAEPGPRGGRDRTAVHGFVGTTDHLRGRRIESWFQRSGYRIELAQELINLSHPFSSPKDPARARAVVVSTKPRTPDRLAITARVKDAIGRVGDGLLTPAMLRGIVSGLGLEPTEVEENGDRLATAFTCRLPGGEVMRGRVVVSPWRKDLSMKRSKLRVLLGQRFERTPETFDLLRAEFLTQCSQAYQIYDQKHGGGPRSLRRVFDWAHRLEFTAPENRISSPELVREISGDLVRPPVIDDSFESQLRILFITPPQVPSTPRSPHPSIGHCAGRKMGEGSGSR